MSIKYFSDLSEVEVELLLKAPALITLLIAGADNDIDSKEKSLGEKLVNYRTFTSDTRLHEYYEAVNSGFAVKLDLLISAWKPNSTEDISQELAGLNAIMPKLESSYADLLKESWRSLAKKVAEADGGFLGMGGINKEEVVLIDLPMIE
ncbi:MAG: hypothetical protein AAF696_21625 [Bacteroidota bacterium]